jgi:MoxR-like ATPase
LDYPSYEQEVEIVKQTTVDMNLSLKPVLSKKDIIEFQNLIRRVPVAENVIDYTVKLVSASRSGSKGVDDKINEWIRWGAGPRASQYLILGAKVRSILHNRYTPEIEDIDYLALPVLRHRIAPSYSAEAEGIDVKHIVNYISNKIIKKG